MTSTPRSNRRRWITRVAVAATSASIGLVATGAVFSPASADAPVKVAWWNFAAGGGQAAPAPDTADGGLRVGVSSQQPLAFGAVQYNLPKDGSATLELAITAITSNANAPTLNAIVACPTKDNNWKAGGDQDAAGAPGFDCDSFHFVGHLSADQSTMTFQVDGSADISDGPAINVPPATSTDPGTGQTPVVAGQQPTSTGGGTAPVAAVAPVAKDNHHDLLLMLLVLLLFAILYSQNASQRAPRRLVGATAPTADGAATPLPVPYPAGADARGLGRFAKPRSGAARPLI